jgi:hypothetical protein
MKSRVYLPLFWLRPLGLVHGARGIWQQQAVDPFGGAVPLCTLPEFLAPPPRLSEEPAA